MRHQRPSCVSEVADMSKQTVAQWWIGGLLAFIPAGILIPSATLALLAHLDDLSRGGDLRFVGDSYSWTMVALVAAGALFALGGAVAQFVAWVGAVLNTRRLPDQRWFHALLWSGIGGLLTVPLFGLGGLVAAVVMLAYLVAGPDGTAVQRQASIPDKAMINRWAGRGWSAVGAGMALGFLVPNLTRPGLPLHGIRWPSLVGASIGFTVAALGAVAVYAALCGAVLNTDRLPDRTWFHRMLWGGIAASVLMPLFGLGAVILAILQIVYGRSAPDGLAVAQPPATGQPVAAPRTPTLTSGSL
jgi:MFS family permease